MTSLLCTTPDNFASGDETTRPYKELLNVSEEEPKTPVPPGIGGGHSIHADFKTTFQPPTTDFSAAERFITQQLSTVPSELELRTSGERFGLGVWTKQHSVHKGTRYGPFLGKWTSYIRDASFSWEVVSTKTGIRAWLDASEIGNWLRHIQVSNLPSNGNLKHVLLANQIYYEATRDILVNEELLLIKKPVIDLDSPSGQEIENRGESPCRETDNPNDELEEGELDADEDDVHRHQCLLCDKNFPGYEELDDHLITSHGYSPGQYVCEYCSRSFSWRPNLIKHKTIHGEYKRYPCENCTRVFTDSATLQKHIRNQHVGARAHACPECGKTFNTSSGLKQHTHIHSSVKPFQCEVCLKAYTQFSNLCRHKRMHADCRLQIKCNKCGQAFSTVTSLAKHKRFCDTAPSLNLSHSSASLLDNKIHSPQFSINNLHTPSTNPLLLYPRPPIPLLPPSLLSTYPMFHSFSSLIGAHNPFLSSSFMLPTQRIKPITSITENILPKLEKPKNLFNSLSKDLSTHYQRYQIDETNRNSSNTNNAISTDQLVCSSGTSPQSPKVSSALRLKESPTDEQLFSETINVKIKEEISDSFPPKEKRERPLDLTTSRKDENELFSEENRPDSSENNIIQPEQSLSVSEVSGDNKLNDKKPKVEPSFFRIADLLKDKISSSSIAPSQNSFMEARSKIPLVYPQPLHPAPLFEMYKQLDGSLHRNTFPVNNFSTNKFAALNPFFNENGNSGNNFGFNRGSCFDIIKAQMNESVRSFGDIGRHYDIMNAHLRSKDRYTCKFCNKIFPRSANLTRHLRTHTGEQPYKCNYCERSFSISSNLQRHVRNIHNKEKPFKCPLCDRCFGQQTNLDRHLKKHEMEGSDIPDSPEAPDSSSGDIETPSNFFSEEIRTFVDKVTDSVSESPPLDESREEVSPVEKCMPDDYNCEDIEVISKKMKLE